MWHGKIKRDPVGLVRFYFPSALLSTPYSNAIIKRSPWVAIQTSISAETIAGDIHFMIITLSCGNQLPGSPSQGIFEKLSTLSEIQNLDLPTVQ